MYEEDEKQKLNEYKFRTLFKELFSKCSKDALVLEAKDSCIFTHLLAQCILKGNDLMPNSQLNFWEKLAQLAVCVKNILPPVMTTNLEYANSKCSLNKIFEKAPQNSKSFCSLLPIRIHLRDNSTLAYKIHKSFKSVLNFCWIEYFGYRPYATNLQDFQTLFYAFGGTKMDILWEETFVDENGTIRWCKAPEYPEVPIKIQGDTSMPHLVVSKAEPEPNLVAVAPRDLMVNLTFLNICIQNVEAIKSFCTYAGPPLAMLDNSYTMN
ncbi:uncharacterized protein LOC132205673 [Neocloeon triangulifer]|uniref:uncharacterized protein LOC132205673 n=1 Tax=Neocloeon triangulifer TaxID=2078957 RepID=UPI00286F05B6|nr:uncharacterized protein LOC132205673 [Neocloeon triangulifer]